MHTHAQTLDTNTHTHMRQLSQVVRHDWRLCQDALARAYVTRRKEAAARRRGCEHLHRSSIAVAGR